jgi:hypothetical protein
MRFSHYLQARVPPGGYVPGGMFAAATVLVGAVHRANVRLRGERRLALGFPDLEEAAVHPAGRVRVFSISEGLLIDLLDDPAVAGLVSLRIMRSAVREVRDEARPVAYVRSRLTEKATLGWNERQLRRTQRAIMSRISLGETPKKMPRTLEDRVADLEAGRSSTNASRPFHIRLRSASTGRGFSLFVESMPLVNDGGEGTLLDSYGLSRRSGLVAVPMW